MSEVALFDLDHTVYEGLSCITAMQAHAQAGIIPAETIQRTTAVLHHYREVGLEFDTALAAISRIYAQALAGHSYTRVSRITGAQFKSPEHAHRYAEFVRPTVQRLGLHHESILVTGQPGFIAAAAAGALGIKHCVSSTFQVVNDTFTGEIDRGLFSGARRVQAARRLEAPTYDRTGSFAFADSEADVALLETVEYPVCVDPTPGLRRIAVQKGWPIAGRAEVPSVVDRLLVAH